VFLVVVALPSAPPVYVNWQMLPLEVHYAIYESMWIGECLYNFDRAMFSITRANDQVWGTWSVYRLTAALLNNALPSEKTLPLWAFTIG